MDADGSIGVIASRSGASLLEPAHLVPGILEVLGRRPDGTSFPARLAVAKSPTVNM